MALAFMDPRRSRNQESEDDTEKDASNIPWNANRGVVRRPEASDNDWRLLRVLPEELFEDIVDPLVVEHMQQLREKGRRTREELARAAIQEEGEPE